MLPDDLQIEVFTIMTDEQKYQLLLVDAICGVGFPSVLLAQECERVGLADYTGNQHSHHWTWDRKALLNISIDQLQELYSGLCEQREENMNPTESLDEPESRILLS